jgi:hypothetical protein
LFFCISQGTRFAEPTRLTVGEIRCVFSSSIIFDKVDKQLSIPTSPTGNLNLSFEEKMEVDARSVYIGNVDYAATAEELEQHFHGCGSINRYCR